MKRKLLLITLLSLLFGASAFAQHQKETVNFLAEFEWNFVGDYTYQYIRQQNGENLLDGPFTMKATVNDRGLPYNYYYTADITGSYNLSGNHSNGALHGPLTMNASLNVKVTNGERQNNTYSFKGNFKNGYPDGNFTVNYPSYDTKVNVNYKNGVLVGAYSVKGQDKDGFVFTTTGTLTSDGKMTGTWKFETAYGSSQMSLLNGVVISRPEYDSDLCNKAKAFASGTVTEEQLLKQNIRLVYDKEDIGKDACRLILHSGIDYDKLGWWSFANSSTVEYCYLSRMTTFSDEGFELLKEIIGDPDRISENIGGAYYYDEEVAESLKEYNFYEEFYEGRIMYDKKTGLYFCCILPRMPLAEYCLGYPDWSDYFEHIYLTKEQFAELQKTLHEARMSRINSRPIKDYFASFRISQFTPCYYDKNVITHKAGNDILYYTYDVYEDYYIGMGQGREVLEHSVEERKAIVEEKIKKYEEELAKAYQTSGDEYLTKNILNKTGESLPYSTRSCSKEYFPVVSFQHDGDVYYDAAKKIYVVPYIFNVSNSLNTDLCAALGIEPNETYSKGGYNTYRVKVMISEGSKEVNEYSTFDSSNFVKVENVYDTLANVEAELLKNHKDIVAKYSATLKDGRDNPYVQYIVSLPWTVDHNNVQATIAEREERISMQGSVMAYIEKYSKLLSGDEFINAQCSKYNDVASAYDTYCQSRELLWCPTYDLAKLDQYIADQECMKTYIKLRDKITENHELLIAKKSSNKKAFKVYQAYYKACDLSWDSQKDLTGLNELILVQKKCIESYNTGTDLLIGEY